MLAPLIVFGYCIIGLFVGAVYAQREGVVDGQIVFQGVFWPAALIVSVGTAFGAYLDRRTHIRRHKGNG